MIPVLDWSQYKAGNKAAFVSDLSAATRGTGFFLLENHGVPDNLIAHVFAQGAAFFALPEAEKARLSITTDNRGWARQGSESLDETSGQIDRKEAFNIGLDLAADDPRILAGEPFRGVNLWPELPGFRKALLAYFDAVQALGVELMQPVARDLGLPERYFDGAFRAPMATLRLLSYPASTEGIGAGAHTDYGALTLLMTDGEPGLQVKPRGGDWIDVPHVPGAFTINIGDCLMRWSNDTYVSTPHRVLPPKNPRKSIAFFLDPDPDAVIEALPGTGAPKYPPVTGADYLRSRLEATYA